jgi:hypothetical protein
MPWQALSASNGVVLCFSVGLIAIERCSIPSRNTTCVVVANRVVYGCVCTAASITPDARTGSKCALSINLPLSVRGLRS